MATLEPVDGSTYNVNESVVAYVTGRHTAILLVTPDLPAYMPVIMHVTVSGSQMTILVPRITWAKLIHVVLVSLKLTVPPLGAGQSALITAGRCTSGRFDVIQHFVYADPGPVDVRTSSPCRCRRVAVSVPLIPSGRPISRS